MSPILDVSQHGEQGILEKYFTENPPKYKHLVDVGAYGKQLSNTWGLLTAGWKGLLIEANPHRVTVLKNEFKNLNVTILNVASSVQTKISPLYINSIGGNDSLLEKWHEKTRTSQIIPVPTCPLQNTLTANSIPIDFDLLSIDIEGMDYPVINHLLHGSAFRPHLIITEIDSYKEPLTFFQSYGYSLYELAGNPVDGNLILVRKTQSETQAI